MKVCAWPTKRKNQYLEILYGTLRKHAGVEVFDFGENFWSMLWKPHEIFHFHWLNALLNHSFPNAFLKCVGFILFIAYLRLRGSKVIWTLHNSQPYTHECRHPFLEKCVAKVLFFLVTSIVIHSKFQSQVFGRFVKGKVLFIPHHNYGLIHRNSELISAEGCDVLYFGQISRYKGVSSLIDLALEIKRRGLKTRIAVVGSAIASERQSLLEKVDAKGVHDGIDFSFKFASNRELEDLVKKYKYVILPYNGITNSGSLVHALSLRKHVLIRKSKFTDEFLCRYPYLSQVVHPYNDMEEILEELSQMKSSSMQAAIDRFMSETDVKYLVEKHYQRLFSL